jgi:hypothetical protein
MATCSHADRLIPLLHDNELQNPLRREMVAHMATCVACARTFSLLEREQELFTHAIEDQVEAVDFANFWQSVEMKLTDVAPTRAARLRLWYESWRPTWAFPVPAWAVATLFLILVPTHLALNSSRNNPPHVEDERLIDVTRFDTSHQLPQPSPSATPSAHQFDPQPTYQLGLNDDQQPNDEQALIESLSTSGSGEVAIQIRHDPASKSTLIIWRGSSEYQQ